MTRALLIFLAVSAVLTGCAAFALPLRFYDAVPGLAAMGPFNSHFVKDAGLAYIASGGALGWGALMRNRAVAIAGALWLALHGLFHLFIQLHRGLPFDMVMWFDMLAITAPAFLAMALAWTIAPVNETP